VNADAKGNWYRVTGK